MKLFFCPQSGTFPAFFQPTKMSTATYSAFAALPVRPSHLFFDEDGDVIMTDAMTGLPITYGGRSRSNSGDTLVASPFGEITPIRIPSVERNLSSFCTPPPPAPRKAPAPPAEDEEEEEAIRPLRNIAEELAAAALEGEPRDPLVDVAAAGAMLWPAGAAVPPPGGDVEREEDWCLSVTCPDLALRLDMRHPRVVLNLLRFVNTYNELAPEGEKINLPLLPREAVDQMLNHVSLTNTPAEFASEVAELRSLITQFSCYCEGCDYNDSYDPYEDDRESERARDLYDSFLNGTY